jgi:hypothetical protein
VLGLGELQSRVFGAARDGADEQGEGEKVGAGFHGQGKTCVAEMTPGHAGNDCTARGNVRPFKIQAALPMTSSNSPGMLLTSTCRPRIVMRTTKTSRPSRLTI